MEIICIDLFAEDNVAWLSNPAFIFGETDARVHCVLRAWAASGLRYVMQFQ